MNKCSYNMLPTLFESPISQVSMSIHALVNVDKEGFHTFLIQHTQINFRQLSCLSKISSIFLLFHGIFSIEISPKSFRMHSFSISKSYFHFLKKLNWKLKRRNVVFERIGTVSSVHIFCYIVSVEIKLISFVYLEIIISSNWSYKL